MATAIPSGILWIAMAKVIPAPICGSFRAPMNVAMPSGKLWMAIASADMIPRRCSAFSCPVFSIDRSETS